MKLFRLADARRPLGPARPAAALPRRALRAAGQAPAPHAGERLRAVCVALGLLEIRGVGFFSCLMSWP